MKILKNPHSSKLIKVKQLNIDMGVSKVYLQLFLVLALFKNGFAFGGLGSVSPIDTSILMNSMSFKTIPNPYFDEWSGTIRGDKKAVTIKIPIKKDLPASMMLKVDVEYLGNKFCAFEIPVCESFSDELIAKDFLLRGIPVGQFPTECPVRAGLNFVVDNYEFPKEKIPPGCPDGFVKADVALFEAGKDPYVTMHVEGEIQNKVASFGR